MLQHTSHMPQNPLSAHTDVFLTTSLKLQQDLHVLVPATEGSQSVTETSKCSNEAGRLETGNFCSSQSTEPYTDLYWSHSKPQTDTVN